jgi:hypothetical protein
MYLAFIFFSYTFQTIKVTERFEEWLSNVESSMKESIRKLIKNLMPCYEKSILQWAKQYPQQVKTFSAEILLKK